MNLCNLRAVFSSFVLVVSFNIVSLAEENVTKKPPEVFVRETIAQLKKAGKNLREKNFFKPVPPYPSRTTLEQYDNIVSNNIRQFDIIWKKVLSSCDPPNGYNNLGLSRKDKLELFLALLRELRGTIDPTFDASIPVEMNVFPEPDKSDDTGQFFLPGMLAEDIKHPKTRENYEKACWENAKNGFEELIHRRVNDLIPPTERVFRERIFKTYNVEPRADAELIELLEKYEYPMEARIKLLCELGIPYKGFRIWQSTDKLFKTTAKFISLNKGNVTLEKADGKHTTIEFSVLR
ncbi:MAG: hypothetical protein LBT46_07045, partial [Planctomycetaceae bacterium]|nr:hypothetical protein [Planctomycetaceae bacterium]